jgi:2-polyprenyl-6-methoxyphenol hydroxylase-like FAD-dependent oxidoreductase
LLLAKRGAQVSVLEGHETFDREFRGEVLQPSTARLLDEIGLLEYVLGQPHLTLTAGRLLVGGRPAGEFAFRDIAPEYPYAIWMPQPVFLEALVKKANAFPSFQCLMGARVTRRMAPSWVSGAGAMVPKGSRSGPTWWWAPTGGTRRSGAWADLPPSTSTTTST